MNSNAIRADVGQREAFKKSRRATEGDQKRSSRETEELDLWAEDLAPILGGWTLIVAGSVFREQVTSRSSPFYMPLALRDLPSGRRDGAPSDEPLTAPAPRTSPCSGTQPPTLVRPTASPPHRCETPHGPRARLAPVAGAQRAGTRCLKPRIPALGTALPPNHLLRYHESQRVSVRRPTPMLWAAALTLSPRLTNHKAPSCLRASKLRYAL